MTQLPTDVPEELQAAVAKLHPATLQVLRWFTYSHLPAGPLRDTSRDCTLFAYRMAVRYPEGGPEITDALRNLLRTKDGLVRCAADLLSKPVKNTFVPAPQP
jgi:hypothetical protein